MDLEKEDAAIDEQFGRNLWCLLIQHFSSRPTQRLTMYRNLRVLSIFISASIIYHILVNLLGPASYIGVHLVILVVSASKVEFAVLSPRERKVSILAAQECRRFIFKQGESGTFVRVGKRWLFFKEMICRFLETSGIPTIARLIKIDVYLASFL